MLSVIIPVLNESQTIRQLLTHLLESSTHKNISEIIVVDGGSVDGTKNIISQFKKGLDSTQLNILVINAEKGRAKQMNAGAKNATGNVLYFLHADSFPPYNFDTFILSEVKKGNNAGCFKMKFDSNHWWLQLASWLTKFSWRACRGGDQSQFITRNLFEEIGGYDESYIIYEDNILINELFARNEFVVIQEWLDTSARLYREKGIWHVQYHFWIIYIKKWMGADANQLYAYYCKHLTSSKATQQTLLTQKVIADK